MGRCRDITFFRFAAKGRILKQLAGWEFEERDMETESGWQRWRLTCDYDTRARTASVCGSQSAKMESNGEGGVW